MRVAGSLRVPGDKSISHRALMFGALAEGSSRVTGILESADVHSTANVLRALGAKIPELSSDFTITGVGANHLRAPQGDLDCGNSGTTARLMAGVVAGCPWPKGATFVGDASLSRRPMRRVARPLEAMGARVELSPNGGLPMTIHGGQLSDLEWRSEVASAQVKSCILLAAVVSGVRAAIVETERTRDHTERMLRARGVDVTVLDGRVEIRRGATVRALDTAVPGDPSSAAFFAGLAALATEGELRLENVCVNETRSGFLETVRRMGASVVFDRDTTVGGEPVSPVTVAPPSAGRLRAVRVEGAIVPTMIDELPLLACLAARASGETVISGALELRVKESDRIEAVVSNLRAIGADAEELPDGMTIRGNSNPLRGRVRTHGDHRLAMAFGVLGALPENAIEIDDPDCVAVSYPNFWRDLSAVVKR
jgi:3-phosphoshikimate 1-carboxyvinyltransferase